MKQQQPTATTPQQRLRLWLQLVMETKDLAWRSKIIDTFSVEKFGALDLNDKIGALAEVTGAHHLEVLTTTQVTGIQIGNRPVAKSRTLCGYLTYGDKKIFPVIQEIAAAIGCKAELDPDDDKIIEIRAARSLPTELIPQLKGA